VHPSSSQVANSCSSCNQNTARIYAAVELVLVSASQWLALLESEAFHWIKYMSSSKLPFFQESQSKLQRTIWLISDPVAFGVSVNCNSMARQACSHRVPDSYETASNLSGLCEGVLLHNEGAVETP